MTAESPAAQVGHLARLRRRLPPPALRRAVRQSAGMSAAQVATALGVTRQAVSAWERGTRCPRGEMLEAYVAVLDELRRAAS